MFADTRDANYLRFKDTLKLFTSAEGPQSGLLDRAGPRECKIIIIMCTIYLAPCRQLKCSIPFIIGGIPPRGERLSLLFRIYENKLLNALFTSVNTQLIKVTLIKIHTQNNAKFYRHITILCHIVRLDF